MSERACLWDRERTFNRAERYVDHDQRETVPILVRPRDDGDSGTVSARTVVDFRDVDDGSPLRDYRGGTPFAQTTRRLNPNILARPIWSDEPRRRRGGSDHREEIRMSLCIDDNFIKTKR